MRYGYTTIHQACLEQGIDLAAVRADLGDLNTTGAGTPHYDRWNAYDIDNGGYQYQLASGDTLSELAALYLDSAARWQEIWALQSASYKQSRTPDAVYADDWIEMPTEAGLQATKMRGGPLPQAIDAGGSHGSGPGGSLGPGEGGGKVEPTDGTAPKKIPTWVYYAGGAALAAWLAYAFAK